MAADAYSLVVELGDASFEEALRYFVRLKVLGENEEPVVAALQGRTEISPVPTTEPAFRTHSFTFPLPPEADPDRWSLHLSAIAPVDDEAAADASANDKPKTGKLRVVGDANLALGGELAASGEIERRVALTTPADAPGAGQTAGNISIKLRLKPQTAADLPSGQQSAPRSRTPGASVVMSTSPIPAVPSVPSRSPAPSIPPANRSAAAASVAPSKRGSAVAATSEREMSHLQSLIDRLTDDVQQKTQALTKADEEVMLQRGINQRLQKDLGTLRAHVDERERAMEQLANDATNVENIDLPQLQSRHRMLGAAYRSDRRQMEQLKAEVAQRSAALATQEQLARSYARLKEAHSEQGHQMQRLQEEARKVSKYRQTAKQQEAIIQRLEALLAAALKDAKRVKAVEPQLEVLRKQHAEVTQQLERQKKEYAKLEKDASTQQGALKKALEEGRVDVPPEAMEPITGGAKREDDEPPSPDARGNISSEEQVKLLMRAEKAERRAAALEDEMQEMARQNGREVAKLKMKLAESDAMGKGGFGSAANLQLGENMSTGTFTPDISEMQAGGPRLSSSLPPQGSSRRGTPQGKRLDPLATAAGQPPPIPAS